MKNHRTQIVMTGAGLVTPLGLTREQSWQGVLGMRCGMGPLTAMESPLPPGGEGGQAPELPADFHPDLPREVRYLRHALLEAMADAGIDPKLPYPNDRCGIVLGTTLHGMRSAGRFLRSGDFGLLKDFLAQRVLRHAIRDRQFHGCALTTCSACSSSLGAIALGITMLRSGQLDLVVAGGYDTISEYVYAGFNSLRLVAAGPLRPFSRDRQGMKLAEGYGIVVLERADDAHRRGAKPLAAVLGYGESADAHHLTQPHPRGAGAARAIRNAMVDAGVEPSDIDLIAAHATGTPDNDASEFAAFSSVFKDQLPRIPVVSFKSHLGHTLGGAGVVELVLSAMALRDQIVPACVNVGAGEIGFPGLNVTTVEPKNATIRATLNTSLGFGGANTCMVLGPANPLPCPPPAYRGREKEADVFITGIGVVFPGIIGNEALVHRLSETRRLETDPGNVCEEQIVSLLNARRVRRMSDYVKISLAATALCLRDAGIEDVPAFADSCAAILGTTHGSSNYCENYYRQIVTEGISAANPMLFAEGVPNAAAAHLSLMLSLKGPCQTVIGSRTAGLDALRLAATRIACGEWERAVVGAAEEHSPVVNDAYRHWGLYAGQSHARRGCSDGEGEAPAEPRGGRQLEDSARQEPRPPRDHGFFVGAGAVSLLLESRSSLESRSARARGRVISAAGGITSASQIPRLARSLIERLGRPPILISSANNTWLDRAERSALPKDYRPALLRPYDWLAECFSALPLGGIAAALLTGKAARIGALAMDYCGAVSGVAIDDIDL